MGGFRSARDADSKKTQVRKEKLKITITLPYCLAISLLTGKYIYSISKY